ncbi:MAG TPA: hypothetical protein VGN20_02320 [Mucilaginibacter sp.]|jgi:hypothetical protein
MEEFTNSTGMKIFYGAIALFMIGFSLFLFNMDHSKAGNGVLAIPVIFVILALVILVSQFKRKIIISADSIVSINAFGRKELPTADVKGCRINQKTISIEPISSSSPKIVINNYSDLSSSDDLVTWLNTNFIDLDTSDLKEEHAKVLNDTSLGFTEEEREQKLIRAKRISMAYNICGSVLLFLGIFLRSNYTTTVMLLIYPLAGILLMVFSNGLIRFASDSKKSAYPFIFVGFMLPAFALLLKSFDYQIYKYNNIWTPFLAYGLVIFFLLYTKGLSSGMPVKPQLIFMIIFSFIYAYGSTTLLNCTFDKSKPQIIHTSIYTIDIRQSKGTHYYLYLKSWDSDPKPKSIEVSTRTFYRYPIGSDIDVHLKKGLLNIPWYYL